MGVRAVSQCDVDICYGCVSKLLVCRHLALTCAWAFGSGSQAADAASLGSVAWKSACYGHVERKQGRCSCAPHHPGCHRVLRGMRASAGLCRRWRGAGDDVLRGQVDLASPIGVTGRGHPSLVGVMQARSWCLRIKPSSQELAASPGRGGSSLSGCAFARRPCRAVIMVLGHWSTEKAAGEADVSATPPRFVTPGRSRHG